MLIQDLGWDAWFEALWNENERDDCVPVRVVSRHRGLWRIAGDFDECWAEASGKLRAESEAGADWPAVGDWVAVEIRSKNSNAIIQQVLPRRSRFVRKAAGKAVTQQVIAANIDVAPIVAAPDGDFNLRRIERYIAQCWESGARPVIVLNKSDACADVQELVGQVEAVAIGVEVFAISALTGAGVNDLASKFVRGTTIALLGSSGVGKSTLVNRLLGQERQGTQPVRESDSKGRHTTTSRQLFLLPTGAMVIDTPGLRELQVWNEADDFSNVFKDVEQLALRCRFSDCRHETEPGCAVLAALASGQLDAARLENRRKLKREQEFLLRKLNPEIRSSGQKRIRTMHRNVRRMYETRDKWKG